MVKNIFRLVLVCFLVTGFLPTGDAIAFSLNNHSIDAEVLLQEPTTLSPGFTGNGHECETGWHYFSDINTYITLNTQGGSIENYGVWQPQIPTSGNWKIEVHNPVHPYYSWPCDPYPYLDHDTENARYEVHYTGGTQTVTVDQQNSPEWVDIGTFYFMAGIGPYVLLGDVTGETDYSRAVMFSGMRFTLISDSESVLVGEPALTPAYGGDYCETGWYRYTNNLGLSSFLTLNTNQPSQSTNSAIWRPNLPTSGRYRVQAYIPNHPWFIWRCTGVYYEADTSDAKYTIYYNGGSSTVSADQMPVSDDWLDLGTYDFATGTGGYVELKDLNSEPDFTRYVSFSAIRFVSETSGDSTLPDGEITQPQDGATVSTSQVEFSANAWDNAGGSGVDRVEFYVQYDGQWHLIASDAITPYSTIWNVPQGLGSQQMIFTIHVVDRAGNRSIDPGGYHYVQYQAPTYSYGEAIKNEAKADIGMPYYEDRGCSSPFEGCGGPYHGFYNGVCTDLVFDAYNAGVPFNLQGALTQDMWLHPGRYRVGSIRVADDLWKYFYYNQILLSKSQPYQIGDVVFFCWSGSGCQEHVGIISEVNADGHPVKMVDAAGEYYGAPASERNWNGGYDTSAQEHGRLSLGPGIDTRNVFTQILAEPLQVLYIEVSSADISVTLRNSDGKRIDGNVDENLWAANNLAYAPYISRGQYYADNEKQQISVIQPLDGGNLYHLEFTSLTSDSFNLRIWTMQDQQTISATEQMVLLNAGQTMSLNINLTQSNGQLTYTASELGDAPLITVQNTPIFFDVSRGPAVHEIIEIQNYNPDVDLVDALISVSNFQTQLGQMLPADRFSIAPISFELPGGGNQTVAFDLNLDNVSSGVYFGRILIVTANSGVYSVPLAVYVHNPIIYLPLVVR